MGLAGKEKKVSSVCSHLGVRPGHGAPICALKGCLGPRSYDCLHSSVILSDCHNRRKRRFCRICLEWGFPRGGWPSLPPGALQITQGPQLRLLEVGGLGHTGWSRVQRRNPITCLRVLGHFYEQLLRKEDRGVEMFHSISFYIVVF